MKRFTVAAVAVTIVLLPVASQAEGARQIHRAHRASDTRVAPALPVDAQARDVYGNNANSPYGDNSAAANANGRTSGGGGFGGN